MEVLVVAVAAKRSPLRVWWVPKAAAPLRSSKGPHMMAFGVTNLRSSVGAISTKR